MKDEEFPQPPSLPPSRRIVVPSSPFGTIVESFSLHSEECVRQLQKALQLSEQRDHDEKFVRRSTTANSRYQMDHQGVDEVSSEASSDADTDNEDHDHDNNYGHNSKHNNGDHDYTGTKNDDDATDIERTVNTNRQNTPTPENRNGGSGKTPEFHPSVIRKHVDTLSIMSFDIPTTGSGTNHEEPDTNVANIIELPTCLLSKVQIQSDSITEQCRAYYDLALSIQSKPVVILFIRSGRFAGAVFQTNQNNIHSSSCTHHRTSVRYTVRKGQGKAQSSQDAQGRKALSIGSQLRRQGEIQLREDVNSTIIEWKEQFQNAAMILISVPRTMQKGLFEHNDDILQRLDPRIRRIPLDLGRPTFENVCLIHKVLLTVTIREPPVVAVVDHATPSTKAKIMNLNNESLVASPIKEQVDKVDASSVERKEEVIAPLSELHIAAQNGNVEKLESLLSGSNDKDGTTSVDTALPLSLIISQPAGIDEMTPLHYAAESSASMDADHAAASVRLLLEVGHANPCIVDKRRRVPYHLATWNDKVRDAFRISRGILGEEYCEWDNGAKVGPSLTFDELNDKLEKEAGKRRKKRMKQKEKKAREKAEELAAEERRLALEEQKRNDEEAKRIRDGLQPKVSTVNGGKACDFCQTICVGKKRINMFKRLEYSYCTNICLQNHKRELMAAAAMARINVATIN